MNKVIAILFAITCFSTSAVSSSIFGIGTGFWIIITTGFIVASSQFFPAIKGAGSGLALLFSLMSILAVIFGLVAATIGGSFKMDDSSALLLFLFFMIAVFGITLASMHKKSIKSETSIST